VRIDLHHHLLHNRRDTVREGNAAGGGRAQWKIFSKAMQSPAVYAVGGWMMRRGLRVLYALGLAGTALDPMRDWNKKRAPVPLPGKSFREQWRNGLGGK
jgi:L-lactate dehydrogenase complex protein LldF